MGIRLDWEIETEGKNIRDVGADPEAARRRRVLRFRLLITFIIVVAVVGGIGGFVQFRIRKVESQLEQTLRDTVMAEVTALRLGNRSAFMALQRSASGEWLEQQEALFDEYQQYMREKTDVRLTGHILGLEIDDPRARVHIQEIIDGVPYMQVWFYWRYEGDFDNNGEADGWRHVPMDPTFWGEAQTHRGQAVTVQYHDVDTEFAVRLGLSLDDWVNIACGALMCDGLPHIEAEVSSQGVSQISWSPETPWLLRLPSPYLDRARSDMPFSLEAQIDVATLLAERLTIYVAHNIRAQYPADAYYLQQAVISWLVGRFVLIDTKSYLLVSLTAHYGETSVGQLLQDMAPDADIGVLNQVTGVPLDQSDLDWRDFFTWRLTLESELIAQQDLEAVLALYDTRDEALLNAAYTRMGQPPPDALEVTVTRPHSVAPDGSPQQAATARVGEGGAELQILFRLVNNCWLRAS